MPEKLDSTYEIYPRELVLYKRPNSTVWQCRYKVDGKWLIASTKLRDREKAIDKAKDLKRVAELKKEANIPVVTKKFKDIARLTKKRMDDKAEKGEAPVSYNVYKRIIDDFLIPCLGNKNIDKIDYAALQQYELDRAELMGKEPAYSTVRKHNVTLNYIFDEAIMRGFMTKVTTTVLNMDGVPRRDIALQLGNSPGIIAKHYDRATGQAIAENVRAPKARKALFNEIAIPEAFQSKKLKKQQEDAAKKKKL